MNGRRLMRKAPIPVCFGLLLTLCADTRPRDEPVDLGPLASLQFVNIEGERISMREFAGAPLLLSFVALPRPAGVPERDPNRSQVVFLRSMVEQYRHSGLQAAIAVCADAAELDGGFRPRVVNFRHDSGLADLPVFADGHGHASRAFGVRELPTMFLMDSSLSIEKRWNGVALPSQLSFAIESALGKDLGAIGTPRRWRSSGS